MLRPVARETSAPVSSVRSVTRRVESLVLRRSQNNVQGEWSRCAAFSGVVAELHANPCRRQGPSWASDPHADTLVGVVAIVIGRQRQRQAELGKRRRLARRERAI